MMMLWHGPLTRYAKLRVAHAPEMPGRFSPPSRVSDSDMHHGTCVTHVPRCMTGSLTSGFIWNRWRGKRSRHSRRMRNLQFCVSGKRPMETLAQLHYYPFWREPIGDRGFLWLASIRVLRKIVQVPMTRDPMTLMWYHHISHALR